MDIDQLIEDHSGEIVQAIQLFNDGILGKGFSQWVKENLDSVDEVLFNTDLSTPNLETVRHQSKGEILALRRVETLFSDLRAQATSNMQNGDKD